MTTFRHTYLQCIGQGILQDIGYKLTDHQQKITSHIAPDQRFTKSGCTPITIEYQTSGKEKPECKLTGTCMITIFLNKYDEHLHEYLDIIIRRLKDDIQAQIEHYEYIQNNINKDYEDKIKLIRKIKERDRRESYQRWLKRKEKEDLEKEEMK